eukprot:CAMPEP_0118658792 /NCGR_PEP_ID=MMETSP0785-20121206/14760_1 /TAXON_ID=91992 /ORGANISM="Bolidomonas pacifica, Strain CCMP 1866" /LENGTH=89 /DNA_ID=CAMNT_0006551839 /DNA_START=633 /DNA_END=902 /DNA_ORIENTATION=-
MCLWVKVVRWEPVMESQRRAEKSPDAVDARLQPRSIFASHTAPLCPTNDPIQSPVSPLLIIGVLSWQALVRKVPSVGWWVNCREAKGRV